MSNEWKNLKPARPSIVSSMRGNGREDFFVINLARTRMNFSVKVPAVATPPPLLRTVQSSPTKVRFGALAQRSAVDI